MRQFLYFFQSFCRSKKEEDPIRENKGKKNIYDWSFKARSACYAHFPLLSYLKQKRNQDCKARQGREIMK